MVRFDTQYANPKLSRIDSPLIRGVATLEFWNGAMESMELFLSAQQNAFLLMGGVAAEIMVIDGMSHRMKDQIEKAE